MQKRSRHADAHQIWGNPMIPGSLRSGEDALPDAIRAVFDLIDMTDPAWPGVAAALREFKDAGIEINPESAAMAVRLGKARWGKKERPVPQPALAAASDSIVYYVRRSALIKIGTTASPQDRFQDLLPDAILAVEPGSYPEENARHRQFSHLRVSRGREYFRTAADLLGHIAEIRSLYGDPDPSWATATLPPEPWRLPLASSTDIMSAAEAERDLGIPRVTIRAWMSRGRLIPAGKGDRGKYLFYKEHLLQLRATPRRRLVGGV